jgi:hypothetical protein
VLNIRSTRAIRVLVHEIIHLMIESDVQKYHISHWEKERIVDLVLHLKPFAFLRYQKWQRDYHGAEKTVDKLFQDHFLDDPKGFFQNLKLVGNRENI